MEKKKNTSVKILPSKIKNINLDRRFFNLNTRGTYEQKNNNSLSENLMNNQNNPIYFDRTQFNQNNIQIEIKNNKFSDMRFAKYQTINKDLKNIDRINGFLINKEGKITSQFDRLIPNKYRENNVLIPEDTKNKNNVILKNKNNKINLDKFNPNIDYSKFVH